MSKEFTPILIPRLLSANLRSHAAQKPEGVWGQGFGPAAELPLGAELYASAGSAGDLVAGVLKQPESVSSNRAFVTVISRRALSGLFRQHERARLRAFS